MRKLETELADRILRYDGVSIFEPELIKKAILKGVPPSMLRVTELNEDIEIFNEQVCLQDKLRLEEDEPIIIDMAWKIPNKYKNIDLVDFVCAKFVEKSQELNYSAEQTEQAMARIDAELSEITRRGMVEFTITIIYILDCFEEEKVVWGVGRGSSCASYVLFILGLHIIDCIKFDIPMSEFFHD